MPTITAVELGADICALARASISGDEISLFDAETLDPAHFPGRDSLKAAVRQTRRTLRLRGVPCRPLGLPDGSSRKDPAIGLLERWPARIQDRARRVPCDALAALARLKTASGDGATCWIAINRGGVAIVVARPGLQLYAHSFMWDSSVGATGSQARLLQRYSLVAILAPQVGRAMAAAHAKGAKVGAIVTCGNLPDLRSLAMPLIEELDIEVETLDSLDGLPSVRGRRLAADVASAIRLACAGAFARGTRPRDASKGRHHWGWFSTAAVLGGVAAVGSAWL
jgi:hypothetical protein